MKHQIFLLVTVFLIASPNFAQTFFTSFVGDTRENWKDIHGSIKRLKSWDSISDDVTEVHYDAANNLTYNATMNKSKVVEKSISWKYNSSNQLTEKIWVHSENIDENKVYKYSYNENGEISNEVRYGRDRNLQSTCNFERIHTELIIVQTKTCFDADSIFESTTVTVYDTNNTRTQEIEIFSNGSFDILYQSEFDENGKLTKAYEGYGANDTRIYNEAGNVISKHEYDYFGNYSGRTDYKYNTKNQLSMLNEFDEKNQLTNEVQYSYNPDDLLVKEIYKDYRQEVSYTCIYVYDANLNLIESQKKLNPSWVQVDEYKFEYDNKENWVRMDQYIGGVLIKTCFREIEYWE